MPLFTKCNKLRFIAIQTLLPGYTIWLIFYSHNF